MRALYYSDDVIGMKTYTRTCLYITLLLRRYRSSIQKALSKQDNLSIHKAGVEDLILEPTSDGGTSFNAQCTTPGIYYFLNEQCATPVFSMHGVPHRLLLFFK